MHKHEAVWISMRNGLVNVMEPEKDPLPHTPDYWCTSSLPYAFDGRARCPQFEAALKRWQPDLEAQELLQDWAGYCLLPDNPYQKFLLNLGEVGGDGKSAYATILKNMIGEENCSGAGIEAFDPANRFGLWPMINKNVNITGDANVIDRMAEGLFKAVVGGDAVTIDRKNKNPITCTLGVKLMINCNGLPHFKDRSNAIWRRMLLVKWEPIPESEQIAGYAEQLVKEEISGIFNWALVGLWRVLQRGFARTGVLASHIEEAQATVQKELGFFDECVGFSDQRDEKGNFAMRTYAAALVEAYQGYCRDHNQSAFLNDENLGKALRKWLGKHAEYGPVIKRLSEEAAAKGGTFELRRREGKSSMESGRRRMFYQGVFVRKSDEESTLY